MLAMKHRIAVKMISKTKSRLKIDCSKYKRTDSEPLEICQSVIQLSRNIIKKIFGCATH